MTRSKSQVKKARDADVRRLQVLMAVADEPLKYGKVALGDKLTIDCEGYFSSKSFQRSCNELLAEGYLVQSDEGLLCLGDEVCQPTRLSPDDMQMLLEHLEECIVTSPHREVLRSVMAKLRAVILPNVRGSIKCSTQRCLFKGRVPSQDEEHEPIVRQLQDAAANEQVVELVYLSPVLPGPINITIDPLGIVYSWFTDAWYIIAVVDGSDQVQYYRVDRIQKCFVTDRHFVYPSDFDLEDQLRIPLGVDGAENVKIKVKFYNVANVLEKVRFETAERCTHSATLVLTKDGAIYTDLVAGINEAAAWLRHYGSSAEVLAPESLRQMMINTARGLITLYTSGLPEESEGVS